MVLPEKLGIHFPKQIRLTNPRLAACLWFLQLSLGSLLLYRFFENRRWETAYSVTGQAIVWVGAIDMARLRAMERAKGNEPLCRASQEYDYWYDAAGQWRYENYSCIDICPTGVSQNHCLNAYGTYLSESPGSVLLTTSLSEMFFWANASFGDRDGVVRYIVPTVEAIEIGLQYHSTVAVPHWSQGLLQGGEALAFASDDSITTIVLDQNQRFFKGFHPHEQISLNVTDILVMAGVSLDEANLWGGRNWLSRTHSKFEAGPMARISGRDIMLDISCHNRLPDRHGHVRRHWTWIQSRKSVVCFLSAVAQSVGWVTSRSLDYTDHDGSLRRRTIQGLRIQASVQGFWESPDMNPVIADMTTTIVWMSLPKAIMFYFVMKCLGRLSDIYRRAICEQFSVEEQCAGMTMRIFANSVAFNDVIDNEDVDGGGISRNKMEIHLRHVLRKRRDELDEEEIAHLVDFCFEAVVFHGKATCASLSSKAPALFGAGDFLSLFLRSSAGTCSNGVKQPPICDSGDVIDIDAFSKACTSMELIGFDELVHLFDEDRVRNLPESFFTPPRLRRYLTHIIKKRTIKGAELCEPRADSIGNRLFDASDKANLLENDGMAMDVVDVRSSSPETSATTVDIGPSLPMWDVKVRLSSSQKLEKRPLLRSFSRQSNTTCQLNESIKLSTRQMAHDLSANVIQLEEVLGACQAEMHKMELRTALLEDKLQEETTQRLEHQYDWVDLREFVTRLEARVEACEITMLDGALREIVTRLEARVEACEITMLDGAQEDQESQIAFRETLTQECKSFEARLSSAESILNAKIFEFETLLRTTHAFSSVVVSHLDTQDLAATADMDQPCLSKTSGAPTPGPYPQSPPIYLKKPEASASQQPGNDDGVAEPERRYWASNGATLESAASVRQSEKRLPNVKTVPRQDSSRGASSQRRADCLSLTMLGCLQRDRLGQLSLQSEPSSSPRGQSQLGMETWEQRPGDEEEAIVGEEANAEDPVIPRSPQPS